MLTVYESHKVTANYNRSLSNMVSNLFDKVKSFFGNPNVMNGGANMAYMTA